MSFHDVQSFNVIFTVYLCNLINRHLKQKHLFIYEMNVDKSVCLLEMSS